MTINPIRALLLTFALLVGTAASAQTYTVQIAAFFNPDTAINLLTLLRERGFPAYIVALETNQGTIYRLRVGEFPNRPDAVAFIPRLPQIEGSAPTPVLAEGVPLELPGVMPMPTQPLPQQPLDQQPLPQQPIPQQPLPQQPPVQQPPAQQPAAPGGAFQVTPLPPATGLPAPVQPPVAQPPVAQQPLPQQPLPQQPAPPQPAPPQPVVQQPEPPQPTPPQPVVQQPEPPQPAPPQPVVQQPAPPQPAPPQPAPPQPVVQQPAPPQPAPQQPAPPQPAPPQPAPPPPASVAEIDSELVAVYNFVTDNMTVLSAIPWNDTLALRYQRQAEAGFLEAEYRILSREQAAAPFRAWRAFPQADGWLVRVYNSGLFPTNMELSDAEREQFQQTTLQELSTAFSLSTEQIQNYLRYTPDNNTPYLVLAERLNLGSGERQTFRTLGRSVEPLTSMGPSLDWLGQPEPDDFMQGAAVAFDFAPLLTILAGDRQPDPAGLELQGRNWQVSFNDNFAVVQSATTGESWRMIRGFPLWAHGDFLLVYRGNQLALFTLRVP